jgi:phosphatidylglycerophosphate synthase
MVTDRDHGADTPGRSGVGGHNARWSAQHHGIDPSGVPLLRAWLRFLHGLATPLVRLRVPPDVLTAAGVVISVAVPLLAVHGWYVAAAASVIISAVLDGLDGAVAVRRGRVSVHGRALDSWADRVSELAWWVALVAAAGVWPWQAVVFGLLGLGMETWRAASGRYGVITVWERPSRAVLAAVGLGAAAAGSISFTGAATGWVGLVLAAVGTVQLALHARWRPFQYKLPRRR